MRCPGDPGDLLEFPRATYSHWAVNIGNNEIAHLTGPGDLQFAALTSGTTDPNIHVRVDSYKDVDQDAESWKGKKVAGSDVTVNNSEHSFLPSALPPQVIVQRALSQLGQPGYQLFYNNCEHFATWCRYGKGSSKQAWRTDHRPIPDGGTREEVDKVLPHLLRAKRHSWCVVMTDERWEHPVLGALRGKEEYWTRAELPWDKLDDKLKEANHISFISSSPDFWMVGWRPGDSDQRVERFRGSPRSVAISVINWAEEQARIGRSLTKLGCHGGLLMAIAEPRKPYEFSYTYCYEGRFNCNYIEEAWARDQKILAVVYFNGWWIIQTSTRVKGQQACIVDDDGFPTAKIKEHIDHGCRIQTIAAGPQWVVIMLKTSDSSRMSQSYNKFNNVSDVRIFIKRNWDQNRCITAVTGN